MFKIGDKVRVVKVVDWTDVTDWEGKWYEGLMDSFLQHIGTVTHVSTIGCGIQVCFHKDRPLHTWYFHHTSLELANGPS